MMTKLMAGETVENKNEPMEFTYEELMNGPVQSKREIFKQYPLVYVLQWK